MFSQFKDDASPSPTNRGERSRSPRHSDQRKHRHNGRPGRHQHARRSNNSNKIHGRTSPKRKDRITKQRSPAHSPRRSSGRSPTRSHATTATIPSPDLLARIQIQNQQKGALKMLTSKQAPRVLSSEHDDLFTMFKWDSGTTLQREITTDMQREDFALKRVASAGERNKPVTRKTVFGERGPPGLVLLTPQQLRQKDNDIGPPLLLRRHSSSLGYDKRAEKNQRSESLGEFCW